MNAAPPEQRNLNIADCLPGDYVCGGFIGSFLVVWISETYELSFNDVVVDVVMVGPKGVRARTMSYDWGVTLLAQRQCCDAL